MDIKHFRYFVAVAETLSFTRAARGLNIAPQPLSTRITELERQLGLRLFDRNTKKVALTAAGEAFLPQAREALRGFDAAMRGARLLLPSQSRHLRIAFTPETSPNVLAEIVSRLQQEQIEICLVDATTPEQHQLLAAGTIDIGVFRNLFEMKGFWAARPLAQPVGVLVDNEHPLAKVDKLNLHDLSPYPLVLFPRDVNPGWYDELLGLCRAGGYIPPRILRSSRPMPSPLKTESAIAFTSEQYCKQHADNEMKKTIWKPLSSPIYKRMSMVCRSDERVGITRKAIDMISDSLQRHDGWIPMTDIPKTDIFTSGSIP